MIFCEYSLSEPYFLRRVKSDHFVQLLDVDFSVLDGGLSGIRKELYVDSLSLLGLQRPYLDLLCHSYVLFGLVFELYVELLDLLPRVVGDDQLGAFVALDFLERLVFLGNFVRWDYLHLHWAL